MFWGTCSIENIVLITARPFFLLKTCQFMALLNIKPNYLYKTSFGICFCRRGVCLRSAKVEERIKTSHGVATFGKKAALLQCAAWN